MTDNKQVGADEPLQDAEGDLYELARVAYHLARVIANLRGKGQVVAVNAPWGGGKTSVVNLTRQLFDPIGPVAGSTMDRYRPKRCPPAAFEEDIRTWRTSGTKFVEFNAWLESSNEGMAFSIIDTISDTLDDSGKAMQFGKRVVRHVRRHPGQFVKGAIGLLNIGNLMKSGDGQTEATFDVDNLGRTLEGYVDGVIKKIEEKAKRVVIVVDDIDRMPPDRIQSLIVALWWVRELPSVSFLLLYDSHQVIDSLARTMFHSARAGEAEASAARFLEKIVQYSFDVPQPTRGQLLIELEKALKDPRVSEDPEDPKDPKDPKEERLVAAIAAETIPGRAGDLFGREQRWHAIKQYILRDLVNTPRAVKRLVIAADNSWAMRSYVPLDFRDLVALEAVRLFKPKLFGDIEKVAARIERGDDVARDWNRKSSAEDTIQAVLMPAHFRGDNKQPLESPGSVDIRRGFGAPDLMSHYLQGVPHARVAVEYNIEDFFHKRWKPFQETLIQAAEDGKIGQLSRAISARILDGASNGRTHKELAGRMRVAAEAVEVSKAFSSSLAQLLREEADLNDEHDYEYE
jgi:hypothetical protein